jgi:Fic family protein
MQKPPYRQSPTVLFSRGTSEWINRVNQKHKQLMEPGLSADQAAKLDRWSGREFVYATLKLEGAGIERNEVARILSETSEPVTEIERATTGLLESIQTVTSLARTKGKAAELTAELLLKLHSIPGGGFRTNSGDTSRVPKPVAPEHLPALIESACRWYTAESFAELNPIEQASIVLLRLIDLQPFEHANQRTALVASSLFTQRSALPPIIIKTEMAPAYANALAEGARMNTKPMVETVAEAVERSLEELIRELG